MLRAFKNILNLLSRDAPSAAVAILPVVEANDAFRLGNEAMAHGELEQAVEHYSRHIARFPKKPSGYIGRGYALTEQARWKEAIDTLNQAAQLDGSNADVYYMLGRAYRELGDSSAADLAWGKAHELAPTLEHVYCDYCLLLFQLGKVNQALSLMQTGISQFPLNSRIHFFLGNIHAELGDYSSAVESYRASLELGDMSAGLYVSLGPALIQTGDYEGAIDILRKAQELNHQSVNAASNYVMAIQYSDKLSKTEKFEAAREFAERFETPLKSYWGQHKKAGDSSNRKLRVGYVSGDFRNHALAFFFEPILACHDKDQFEVYCYYTHPVSDNVTRRIQSLADHWLSCHEMSDDALAARIREDGIDILVDLSGHTGHNRLLTFARKPAPVQMTWLGYQATTGLQAMDYRITEESLDPTGTSEQFHSEKLIRLSSSGTFSPSPDSPQVNALPALSTNGFTFGCLNNPAKITEQAISMWAQILRGNDASRLLFGNATQVLIDRISAQFRQHGIDPGRLAFRPKVGLKEYLALHHEIDMALDTFPYNGGTTTFHSLWMGVPVVTLEGDSTLSKVGVAAMSGMGLGQFCTNSPEQYIERALYFSRNLEELSAVRQSLRSNMDQITQHLTLQVTRSLEDAMQSCWKTYCCSTQVTSP